MLRYRCPATAAVFSLVLFPYARRLSWPSLYADDAVRVAFLQTETLRQSLIRPFNEHLAPLFEVVGRVVWILAGERLSAAPLAFTLASYVPFLIALALLHRLARIETGDETAALAAVAIFGLSELPNEVVFWYSASSFGWAFCGILVTWLAVLRLTQAETRRGIAGWGMTAAVASLAAPCFCGLGILAGPVAALRVWASGRRRLAAFLPMLGTVVYLTAVMFLKHRGVLMNSIGSNLKVVEGAAYVARAPFGVLVPSLFGGKAVGSAIHAWIAWLLLAVGLIGLMRSSLRAVLVTPAFLILTAYGITYPFRIADDPAGVLTVQRYHLLPQAGLALLIAIGWSKVGRLKSGMTPVLLLSVALLLLNGSGIRRHAGFFRYPEQAATLSVMERVPAVAARLRLTRGEVIRSLDPLRNAWTPDPRLFNTWEMLPVWEATSRSSLDPRPEILASFSATERDALCAGMDVGRYVLPVPGGIPESTRLGVLQVSRMARLEEGRFESLGPMSFLELDASASDGMTALVWSGMSEGELWWTDARGAWSPARALTWAGLDPTSVQRLSFHDVPHWGGRIPRRIRLVARRPGPIQVTIPALVR